MKPTLIVPPAALGELAAALGESAAIDGAALDGAAVTGAALEGAVVGAEVAPPLEQAATASTSTASHGAALRSIIAIPFAGVR
jgi:hypothetical protein